MPTFNVQSAVSSDTLNPFANDLPTETITIGNDGEILFGLDTGNRDLGKLAGSVYGLIDVLGTQTTRRGFSKLFSSVSLTGTWTTATSNNIVNGVGGNATSELNANELVLINGKAAKVSSVINNNQFTLVNNSYENLAGVTIDRIKTVAETLPEIYAQPIISNATLTVDYVNGNDTTGGLTSSFATLQGCINWLSKFIIQRTATVTINVSSNCGVRDSSEIRFSHPQGDRVVINALNEGASLTVTSAIYASPTLTVTTSTNHLLNTGDYVTITGITPSNYNLFGIVTGTPASNQFTINIGAGLTIPAYIGGGFAVKQGNVLRFNNTNGFVVNGCIGELNIALSQTGTLSGEEKSGLLIGGLKEVIGTINYFGSFGSILKGKLYSIGFYNGLYLNYSFLGDGTVISNKNINGILLDNSLTQRSAIYANNNLSSGIRADASKVFISTTYTNNCTYGLYGRRGVFDSITFVANNNTNGIVLTHYSELVDCTIGSAFTGNTSTDLFLTQYSSTSNNGLTGGNHTSNVGFQTFSNSNPTVGCYIFS